LLNTLIFIIHVVVIVLGCLPEDNIKLATHVRYEDGHCYTNAYIITKHCLTLARGVMEQGNVYVRSRQRRDTQGRNGGGRGSWFSIIWLTMYMTMINICVYFISKY